MEETERRQREGTFASTAPQNENICFQLTHIPKDPLVLDQTHPVDLA